MKPIKFEKNPTTDIKCSENEYMFSYTHWTWGECQYLPVPQRMWYRKHKLT